MYVFFLDAAVTERLLSQAGSLLTYLEEEDDLQAEGGGKLRKSILTGTNSPACMAAVRSMAIIADTVLWKLLVGGISGTQMDETYTDSLHRHTIALSKHF